MSDTIRVQAVWDDEAAVWVATSADVPGLVTEADTLELLVDKLPGMICDLVEPAPIDTPLIIESRRETVIAAC